MASAGLNHHVLVLFENHVGAFIKVQNRYATELGGGAARLGHVEGGHEVDEGLDDGVVGGVHVGVEGEGALAVAVVGGVAVRGDDPVLPAQVAEADIQRPLLTSHPPMSAAVEITIHVIILEILLKMGKVLLPPGGFGLLLLLGRSF